MSGDDHSGEVLGERYRLTRKLAEGGMGAVYLAEHVEIGGKLAVKLLRSELAESALFLRRFRREARATAALRHRNIVKLFDAGLAPWGEPYMVMEYLQGESLRALLGRCGPLPLGFAVEIARQALEGLAVTHEAGIVHRDLKPDNLILVYEGGEEPTVKLIDFGISKFAPDQATELTSTGVVLGTARYMSPEQAEGREDVDGRTDIYAMGVVLYHMLTGAFPHDGAGHKETLAHVLHRPPVPPAEHCAGFPDGLSRAILKALARDPADRYPGALEMADALARLDLAGSCQERESPTVGADDVSVVSGDLGEPADGAAQDETRPARPATQRRAAGRAQTTAREWIALKGPTRSHRRTAVVAIALAALVLATAALWRSGAIAMLVARVAPASAAEAGAASAHPRTEPPRVAPSPAPVRRGVLVSVEGTPDGSRIFWDGALVPMNPFRVERRETITPLRVEADGYETFSVAVLPTEDQIVHVAMAPTQAAAPRKAGRGHGGILDRGSASTSGGRAMDEERSVIARNKAALKRCYDRALARGDAPRKEDLVVHFRLDVGPNGRVREVSLAGSGAAVPPFAQCLDAEVRSWFFLPTNGAAVVSFSFAFTTSG
jgi:tRNA A-37 threonylcarbamoyl transferase component Bud32